MSRTPALSDSELILAAMSRTGGGRAGPARSFCTCGRRRCRFPQSNICSRVGLGRLCGELVGMTNTVTEPRPETAVRTPGKHLQEPVSRWFDGMELLANGGCLLEFPRASARVGEGERDCEKGRGHGCRKHPI